MFPMRNKATSFIRFECTKKEKNLINFLIFICIYIYIIYIIYSKLFFFIKRSKENYTVILFIFYGNSRFNSTQYFALLQ